MTRAELSEAVAAWEAIVAAVAEASFDRSSTAAPELRRACAAALAGGRAAIAAGGAGAVLAACFEAARMAGAPATFFSRIRAVAEGQAQAHAATQVIVSLAVRLALAAEAQALAETTFASRDDVDAALSRLRPAFESVIDATMAARESEAHKAFGQLYAAVVSDLTARARRMPRVVVYRMGLSLPALALANRLYGDAGRSGELAAENKVVHPLFMPVQGRALAI